MNYSVYTKGINGQAAAYDSTSIHIKNNTKVGQKSGQVSFEGVVVSGMPVDKKQLEGNTYEALLKSTEDVKSQIMASAADAKANLKALFNRLNGSEAVRIDEDGFNLNDMTPEEMVSILDKIQIELAAYCENYQVTGTGISAAKIEAIVGNKGLAESISAKMEDAGLPVTEDNVEAAADAFGQIDGRKELSEGAKNYLVRKELEPTIENIHFAEHAAGSESGRNEGRQQAEAALWISEEEWEQLKPQIEKLLVQAGTSAQETDFANAKSFLAEGIPVTAETLLYKRQLDALQLDPDVVLDSIVDTMAAGKSPRSASVTGAVNLSDEVARALRVLNQAEYDHVALATKQAEAAGEAVSLRSIEEAIEQFSGGKDDVSSKQEPAAVQKRQEANGRPQVYKTQRETAQDSGMQPAERTVESNYKMLIEVRILMTASSGMYLAKQGVSVMASSISVLHEQLMFYDKEDIMEKIASQLADNLDSADTGRTQSLYEMVYQTRRALFDIKYAPDVAIGAALKESETTVSISIASFSQTGSSFRERFRQANATYEAVGTAKRTDLGDSIAKAVRESMSDILDGLGLEHTQANEDAVRILGYNEMEMTTENIFKVKELYQTLKSLIKNMTPQACLDMIRDGMNPMSDEIHKVNEYLQQGGTAASKEAADTARAEETTQEEAFKYSMFLYKLDRTAQITEEERKQFIGIYRMLHMFTKDAGVAIGALCKQNADITMENLCAAFNSRKHAGMDYSIDDASSYQVAAQQAYYVGLFEDTKTSITPLTLKNVQKEQEINTRTVEDFCEAANQLYDAAEEAAYYDELLDEMRKTAEADDNLLAELQRSNEPVTLSTIEAYRQFTESGGFSALFTTGMFATGKIGPAAEKIDAFLEKVDDAEALQAEYDSLLEESDMLLREATKGRQPIGEEDSAYQDLRELILQNKQIQIAANLSRRHDYNIPYATESGIGMMKLTLVSDSSDKGRISLGFESAQFGRVSVEARVTAKSMGLYGVCREEEGVLREKLEQIAETLTTAYDFESVQVYCGRSETVNRVIYDHAAESRASDELYKIAKTIIFGLV